MTKSIFSYEIDTDGLAVLTWDDQNGPVNSLSQAAMQSLSDNVDELVANVDVKGVVLASGKSDFVVGANLKEILTMQTGDYEKDVASTMEFIRLIHSTMRKMETGGKPFVAALNGTALGGGMEVALACHQRIAADNAKAKFGFPEVNLGLLPGGGGTQRLARMVGVEKSLPWLTQATQVGPEPALEAGLVDQVVAADDIIATAKRWLKDNPAAIQPWDVSRIDRKKKFRLPGGEVQTPKVSQVFMGAEAMLRKKTLGNYNAPQKILEVLFEGCQAPIDAALEIEGRGFTQLLLSSQSKAMIRTFFMALQDANKLKNRPKGVDKARFSKVGILGAGMMGAGIAYSSAMSGIQVVLLDSTQESADKGKAYSEGLLTKRVSRRKMAEEKAQGVLSLIKATTDYEDLEGCELVIEAVFEDRAIKADVTAKAEAVIGEGAIFASNTSTLPITGLAEASKRPEQFIGLHFFSPVDKMQLVEVILGEKTSDETLAKSLDYIQQIRKTPITVNDSRGFYTSRVFKTYVLEGMALLKEGVAPALIENAGRMAGMPVGPLVLTDEVTLELMDRISTQTRKDLGDAYIEHPADEVVNFMVHEVKRIGKKVGQGFYDYSEDRRDKKLWSGLAERFPVAAEQPDVEYVKERLLAVQAVETLHCFNENVITNAMEADIGSIFGWGFAAQTGGVISYVETILGLENFIKLADDLAENVGQRYALPEMVREKAEKGESFYG
jgi:3-hydroxyacyl-CoA dehydrogenase/enoyl-CoA hydratase/3-hydroxybutyryl-CoA epimerase